MRLFGTNGIREIVGERLTPTFAASFASAVGTIFPRGAPIVLGWDGRTSSPDLARIVGGTLALYGQQVIRLGLLPTPAIQYNVPRLGAQLGVIVTASHNPPEFNGFKCIASDGLEVERSVETAIESAMEAPPAPPGRFDRLGTSFDDDRGGARYLDGILGQLDRAAIAHRKFTIVLDCANGASAVTTPALLRRLGCRVISLNAHIDGTFPGHRSEPTEANLSDLRRVVPALGADLGVAHDGDADRAVFVDAAGQFVPGEKVLTLLAQDRVSRHHGGIVVTPVSGTRALEEVIRPMGGEVVYTRVGSPAVTRAMQKRSAVFGGEENGGLIFPELHLARDGAMTVGAVLEYLASTALSLHDAIARLPDFTLVKLQVDCPRDRQADVLATVTETLRARGGEIVLIDGIKSSAPDGWILLRPSGTEPLLRIFAESRDGAKAAALAADGKRLVETALAGSPGPTSG